MNNAKKNAQLTNEEIREMILSFFYYRHKSARSLRGLRISKVKQELKRKGLDDKQIISNLDYLIQNGWIVKEEGEPYQIKTNKGIIATRKSPYYKISSIGIDHFEGPSKFQRIQNKFAGINITNIQGIIQLGDGNVVNAEFKDLYLYLGLLAEEIKRSDKFPDQDKLNYQAEIDTVRAQLSKPIPDKSIIQKSWEKIKVLSTISSLINLFEKIAKLIEPLLK
jgi:hypothetical protein